MTQQDSDDAVGEVAMGESIDDASSISDDALRTHYRQSIDVWEQMSTVDSAGMGIDYESLIVPGTASSNARAWYRYDDQHIGLSAVDADIDDIDEVTAGRPWSMSADREQLIDELLGWDYRLPHLSINYQRRTADEWTTKVDGDWVSGRPLPDYDDIDALTLFADVDLEADAKERPVDPHARERIEILLGRWRDAYAGAVGDDWDAVRMLDSVGGTYVLLRPAVTAPICEFALHEFDTTGQQLLIDEISSRWRAFNDDIQSAIDADSNWDAFGLDGNTNKNRLFKPPLAVHKSLPGVVTPIDIDDINFEFTHVSDVDGDLIEKTESWAASFTAREDDSIETNWAGELLASLFEDVAADNWRSDIRDWITDRQTADAAGHEQAAVGANADDIDVERRELTSDVSLVASKAAVWDTIDSLDCEQVAHALGCISSSERQDADDATRIEVTWRQSGSGDSAMVNSDQFSDMDGMEGKGGPADLVAYNQLGTDQTAPTDWRSDSNQIETVLRWFWGSRFDVPVFVPERGSDREEAGRYQRTPNWAIRQVAELLDIAPAVAFDNETDECLVPRLFNRILTALEQADINHGRKRKAVRINAAGDSIDAADLDIDIDAVIAGSPIDINSDTADDDGHSASPSGEDASTETNATATTWADQYSIEERDNVTESGGTYHTTVPGVDLQWIELDSGRAGWGWTDTQTGKDGIERRHYDIVINADIELISRLEFTNQRHKNTQWKLRVNPTLEGENARTVTLTPAAFNGSRELREELVGQCESVVFNTHGKGIKAVNELKQFVHSQTASRRIAHDKIELVNDDEEPVFVTPAGTIGVDGWIDGAKHTYHGIADGVEGDWRADPDTICAVDDDLVRQVCELLPRVRDDREQWLSMIGYAFASSFRPILFNQPASRVDTWNLLHVSGKSGAGKSAVAKTLSGALGMNMKSTTGAEKTSHAQEHMFSATNGMPVAMDEYNPVNWANWKTTAFHEHLKKSTDAQSIEKGNPDQSLTEYRFEVSPMVLGEQTLPESIPALPRRAIEVSLSTTATKADSETASLFNDLRGLKDDDYQSGLHHHAVAWWSHVCDDGSDALELVNRWHETMEWIEAGLQRRDIDIHTELEREMHQQGLQTVTFGLQRWREFAVEQGADPDVLFTDTDIIDTLEYLIKQKTGEQATSINNEDTLLELFASAAAIRNEGEEYSTPSQKYVEYGEHYRLVHADSATPTELRFHLKSSLPQLSKYIRDYDINIELYEKSDYYRWFDSSSDDPDTPVTGVQKRTSLNESRRRCVSIRFDELTDSLDIHPDDIIPTWVDVFDDDDMNDDDNTDGNGDVAPDHESSTVNMGNYNVDTVEMTPLADIDTDQPIASTTASIEFGESDQVATDDNGPDIKATLTGDDGTEATLIAWNAADIELPIDRTGALTCEEVTVRGAQPSQYEETLQLTVTDQTVITPAVDPGQQSIYDINADSDDRNDNEQASVTDGGTTDDFDAPDQATRIERIRNILEDTDGPIEHEKLISKTDWSAVVVTATLEPLLRRQAIMKTDAGYVLS
jgi:putative DNA primase/helicase